MLKAFHVACGTISRSLYGKVIADTEYTYDFSCCPAWIMLYLLMFGSHCRRNMMMRMTGTQVRQQVSVSCCWLHVVKMTLCHLFFPL